MTSKIKTIAADESAYDAFRQLAKEYQLSNPELLAAMVQYFRVTKADPRQPTGPDLASILTKLGGKLDALDKRTIGFIREQEKQYLKPILAQVQAQQLLSTPAPTAPVGLSEAEVQELGLWFKRLLHRSMQPHLLRQSFLDEVLPKPPAAGQAAPSLKDIKSQLIAVLQVAFRADQVVSVAPSAPSAPIVSPTSPPSQS